MPLTVKVIPNATNNPPSKLAEIELHFTDDCGPLDGLKLIGFGVWENRTGKRNVTFPARQYQVNGDKRSFALLRCIDSTDALEPLRAVILDAYADYLAVHDSTATHDDISMSDHADAARINRRDLYNDSITR